MIVGRTVHTVDDADETPEQKDDQKNRGFVTSAERTVQKDNVKDERTRDDDCINYLATKEESSTAPHETLLRHYYAIISACVLSCFRHESVRPTRADVIFGRQIKYMRNNCACSFV